MLAEMKGKVRKRASKKHKPMTHMNESESE